MRRRAAIRKLLKKDLRIPTEFLHSSESIVEFSFIVCRSLTHLDLSLCEFSKFFKEVKRKEKIKNSQGFFLPDNFVYTEETCRKRVAEKRKVLYDFHLDVTKGLEPILKKSTKYSGKQYCSDGVLLHRMVVSIREVCELFLNRIILDELEKTNQKVRLIHHISKLGKREKMKFISENRRIREKSLMYLCFQRADSSVVQDFLTVMNYDIEHLFTFSVHVFEFVVRHAAQAGCNLWSSLNYRDPVHISISYGMFVKTEVLLEYGITPEFCSKIYASLQNGNRWSLPENALTLPEERKLLTKERHLLILEIIRIFWGEHKNGLKALQMMWRSIPDPFINLEELQLSMSRLPTPEITTELLDFFKNITGEEVREESGHQPRKLEHHCRIVIRDVLKNNKQMPSGINKLKLPTKLKSFLKLEN